MRLFTERKTLIYCPRITVRVHEIREKKEYLRTTISVNNAPFTCARAYWILENRPKFVLTLKNYSFGRPIMFLLVRFPIYIVPYT